MPIYLFVYGTLRSASRNLMATRLRTQAIPLGAGTANGLLYDFGSYPGAVFTARYSGTVTGEVYVLDSSRLLRELDLYEGVNGKGARALFRRITIIVRLTSGENIDAWTYALAAAPSSAMRIGSGDFIAHLRRHRTRAIRS